MENEIILTAKTVEEAMEEARSKYGAPDKELSFTILEMPKKGFLGLGSTPAKVKVTITKALEEVDLSSIVADISLSRSLWTASRWPTTRLRTSVHSLSSVRWMPMETP